MGQVAVVENANLFDDGKALTGALENDTNAKGILSERKSEEPDGTD